MPAGTMHRHGRLMGKRGVGMRKGLYTAITALFAVLLLTGCGGEQAEPLDLRAEYAIDAVLEPEAERLAFTQSVTVRNGGDNATEELWFQLRANRFAAEDAKLTVSSVTGADGEPLEYELSGYDQLCRVALPAPLEGGGTATVNFTCELGIPECARLLGTDRYGQIHLPYFYAQLAVCDENGWDRSFWNPDDAETDGRYAVPADFRLAVTAPESYALASNGELVSRETGGGLTRWAFEAENRREIRDGYQAAKQSMEELERQIRARYNDTASADLRVNKASMEMELSSLFRHQVKNTDPDKAREEIRVMMEEHQKKQNAKKGTTVEN